MSLAIHKRVNYKIFRDSAVNWINDIEKDNIYRGWPASVNEVKYLSHNVWVPKFELFYVWVPMFEYQ